MRPQASSLREALGLQGFDGPRGGRVHALRGVVVVIVAQVRADHDDGFVSAPQSFQAFGDLARVPRVRSRSEGPRRSRAPPAETEAEPRANAPSDGHRRGPATKGRASSRRRALSSIGTRPSGVSKSVLLGTARPSNGTWWLGPSSTTRWTTPARPFEQDECARGDRTRVHVARVRHDERFGPRVAGAKCSRAASRCSRTTARNACASAG